MLPTIVSHLPWLAATFGPTPHLPKPPSATAVDLPAVIEFVEDSVLKLWTPVDVAAAFSVGDGPFSSNGTYVSVAHAFSEGDWQAYLGNEAVEVLEPYRDRTNSRQPADTDIVYIGGPASQAVLPYEIDGTLCLSPGEIVYLSGFQPPPNCTREEFASLEARSVKGRVMSPTIVPEPYRSMDNVVCVLVHEENWDLRGLSGGPSCVVDDQGRATVFGINTKAVSAQIVKSTPEGVSSVKDITFVTVTRVNRPD